MACNHVLFVDTRFFVSMLDVSTDITHFKLIPFVKEDENAENDITVMATTIIIVYVVRFSFISYLDLIPAVNVSCHKC